jgi:DNA-binding MurR/RpiR family transcriptional regulator
VTKGAMRHPRAAAQPEASEDGLEARILRVLRELTPKQQRLARTLLEDELYVAFASAEDVGRRAGVDAATVVRFSRVIGYDGYADLRDSVRRGVPQFLTAVERVSRRLEAGPGAGEVLPDVFAQDVRNIEETARLNAPETIADAVAVIEDARRVFCVGHGISAFVADHLAHQLALVGVPIQRAPRSIVEGAIDLASIAPGDAVVVVSVWRYLKHTLLLAEAARSARAKVIGLTDNKAAPIAAHADIVLTAATETAELGHSVAAMLTLSNVVVTGVALASPERALARLKRIDEFYEKFDVMAE